MESPGKELLHTRMDLEALQDVTRLLKNENDRLRQLLQESSADHAHRLREMVDAKISLETHVAELKVELEHSRSDRSRLEAELIEAVGERRRQSQLVQDVRRQVDGRLSKLMEELHLRDEEVHKLEYQHREKEREIERLRHSESTIATQEAAAHAVREQLATVQKELSTSQQEAAALRTELRLVKERNSIPEMHAQAIGAEAASVLPLYRQWANYVEHALVDLEDNVEAISDAVIDTEYFYQYGLDNLAAQPDRRRLAAMKRMDRDRLTAQQQLIVQASANSDNDAVALTVQAIRSSCDVSRYTVSKCATAIVQLKEQVASLHDKITQRGGSTSSVARARHNWDSSATTRVSPVYEVEALESLKQELHAHQRSIVQQKEALASKEDKILELAKQLAEAQARTTMADSALQQSQHEVARKQSECDAARKTVATLESESQALRDELQRSRVQYAAEREASTAASRELDHRSSTTIRSVQEEAERKLRDAQTEAQQRIRSLESELSECRKELSELNLRDERMRSVLEESRQKRLALKRQREELLDEVQDLRNTIAMQTKEVKQANDLAKSVSVELERTKLALEVELQHQEASQLQAGTDASLFAEWKQSQSHHHHNPFQRSTNASSSRVVLAPASHRRR